MTRETRLHAEKRSPPTGEKRPRTPDAAVSMSMKPAHTKLTTPPMIFPIPPDLLTCLCRKGEILLVYLVWWRAPVALCIYSSVTLEDARPA